jgi:hypothetical protein
VQRPADRPQARPSRSLASLAGQASKISGQHTIVFPGRDEEIFWPEDALGQRGAWRASGSEDHGLAWPSHHHHAEPWHLRLAWFSRAGPARRAAAPRRIAMPQHHVQMMSASSSRSADANVDVWELTARGPPGLFLIGGRSAAMLWVLATNSPSGRCIVMREQRTEGR